MTTRTHPGSRPGHAPDGAPERAAASDPAPASPVHIGGGWMVLAVVVVVAILAGGAAMMAGAPEQPAPSSPQALDAER